MNILKLSGIGFCVFFLSFIATPAFAGDGMHMKTSKNIVETAQEAGSFTTLVSLLQSSGLDKVLAQPGPFTVFAPTDEAFSKVPAETLAKLKKDPEALKSVLTYHVVSGKVLAASVADLSSAKTVQGSEIEIDTSNGVMVDKATVTATDVIASNGVIHVVDSVLMPKG